MSTLEFFDLYRAFVGEIEGRKLSPGERQQMYNVTVTTLKDILAGGAGHAHGGYQQTPQLFTGAAVSQPQVTRPVMQQQQQPQQISQPVAAYGSQPVAYSSQPVAVAAPPPQAAPPAAAAPGAAAAAQATFKANDPAARTMLRAMNDAAYSANSKLTTTYKNMVGHNESLTAELLSAGFAKIGVQCSVADMHVIIAPFQKNGEVNYGAFVRMLGSA